MRTATTIAAAMLIVAHAVAAFAGAPSSGDGWYYCDPAHAYFPYVSTCPEPWRTVVPNSYGQNQPHVTPPTVGAAAPARVAPVPTARPAVIELDSQPPGATSPAPVTPKSTPPAPAKPGNYQRTDVVDIKLDGGKMEGARVEIAGLMDSAGGWWFVAQEERGIFLNVDTQFLPREERKALLLRCVVNPCRVKLRGIVKRQAEAFDTWGITADDVAIAGN